MSEREGGGTAVRLRDTSGGRRAGGGGEGGGKITTILFW